MSQARKAERKGQLPADARKKLLILMAGFFVGSAVLSEVVKPGQDEYRRAARAETDYRVDDATYLKDTSFQALAPTLLGAREVMASLMWVQADDYFHRGEYRPIISMVKQITAIDPHQLDVFATGAWHMAYNFMDKRLIQDGVEFLQEGCDKNSTVYDLFFERGYMHYDKTKLYPEAIKAYQESSTKRTTAGKATPPSYVRHQLAHAIEKSGDIDAAVVQWERNLEVGKQLEAENPGVQGAAGPNVAAAYHNLYITKRRLNERLAAVSEREGNAKEALKLWQANAALADEWLKEFPGHGDVVKDRQRATNEVDRLRAGKLRPQALADVDLHFTVTRIGPKKLQVEGTIDVLDLSRVRVQFQDKDYETRTKSGPTYNLDWKMANCSLEWEDVSVNKNRFKHVVNLDRDPADMERAPSDIYPLKAEQFELSVSYNPRLQAAFIQDRYGWHGEGLTAREGELITDPSRAGKMNGRVFPLRYVKKTVLLSREDVLGKEKKVLFKD
ncbi:MAG: hypothetical protein ACO1SX_13715 [Actinomycetota bacterium]